MSGWLAGWLGNEASMRKYLLAVLLLAVTAVLGGTVLREPIARFPTLRAAVLTEHADELGKRLHRRSQHVHYRRQQRQPERCR